MRAFFVRLAGLAATAMIVTTESAAGQSRGLELNAFAGFYVPTNNEALQDVVRNASRRGSLLYGGRLTYWTGQAVGIEFVGGFSPARVSVASARGVFPRSTNLGFGAGKLMLNLTPGSKLIGVAIGGGIAGLHNSKSAASATTATSDIGGIGGLSLRLHVGENVAIRGDLEDLFYGGNFGKGNKFTQDLLLSVGLAMKL